MTEQRTRTVTNAVPVTRTRTVQVCVPTTTMKTVTKDYGHWEEQVVEAAPVQTESYGCGSSMGGCGTSTVSYGGCGSSCGGCSSGCGGCESSCGGCSSGCGDGCGASSVSLGAGSGCGAPVASSCGTQTKRVWVPNVVTEQVPVTSSTTRSEVVMYTVYEQQTTQLPYECTKSFTDLSNVPEPRRLLFTLTKNAPVCESR